MGAKTRWAVRVVWFTKDRDEVRGLGATLLECLRYAGCLRILSDDEHRQFFEVSAPAGVSDTKLWAEMNARRMASFGWNAVAAPTWDWRSGNLDQPRGATSLEE